METILKIIKDLLLDDDGCINQSSVSKTFMLIFGIIAGFILCCIILLYNLDDDADLYSGNSIELVND